MFANKFRAALLFKKVVSSVLLMVLFSGAVCMANASFSKGKQAVFFKSYSIDTSNKIQQANRLVLTEKSSKKILRKVKNGKAILVDVRTPEEFSTKHLKYATNINIKSKNFVDEVAKLDKSKPFYFYCRSGHRSGMAADTLQTLGYKTVFSIGAIDSLTRVGLPLDKP